MTMQRAETRLGVLTALATWDSQEMGSTAPVCLHMCMDCVCFCVNTYVPSLSAYMYVHICLSHFLI